MAARSWRRWLWTIRVRRPAPANQFSHQLFLLAQRHQDLWRQRRGLFGDGGRIVTGRQVERENQNPESGQTGPGSRLRPQEG